MHIAFASVSGAEDSLYWSGTPFFMGEALKRALKDSFTHLGRLELVAQPFKQKCTVYEQLLRQKYIWELEPLVHEYLSIQVERKLRQETDVSLIFSPGCFPYPNAFLTSQLPVVFWGDATFANLLEEHPGYADVCQENIWIGHALQQRILDQASLAIFATDWAAESALKTYGISEKKVEVVPFGANLKVAPMLPEEAETSINGRSQSICNLAFIGTNWEKKGGDLAVAVMNELNTRGISTNLTIVGSVVPDEYKSAATADRIVNLPFLSKQEAGEEEQLIEIMRSSHFLLFPTSGDCFGLVVCEANANAVPVLARRTGGVPSIINDDVNGKCFDRSATASNYADYVAKNWQDARLYKKLCLNSLQRARELLNWTTSAEKVRALLSRFDKVTH